MPSMAHNSKRNTAFPGALQQARQLALDRSLSPSPRPSLSDLTRKRDHRATESSHRPSIKSKSAKYTPQRPQHEPELIPVWDGSPWKAYEDRYRLELGVWFTLAGKKPRRTGEVVAVRSISGPNAEEDIYRIRLLCHRNLLSVHEIFNFEDSSYIVSERMQISLEHVVASPAYPDEAEMASIIWQVGMIQR